MQPILNNLEKKKKYKTFEKENSISLQPRQYLRLTLFQIFKRVTELNLEVLFWTKITILNFFFRFLKTSLKYTPILFLKKKKKDQKNQILFLENFNKEKNQSKHSKKWFELREQEENSWLNEVKDWETYAPDYHFNSKKAQIQNPIKRDRTPPLGELGWFFFKRNNFSKLKNKAPQRKKKKKKLIFKKKEFSRQEENSLRKSHFKIKINKIDLFSFEKQKKEKVLLRETSSALSNKIDWNLFKPLLSEAKSKNLSLSLKKSSEKDLRNPFFKKSNFAKNTRNSSSRAVFLIPKIFEKNDSSKLPKIVKNFNDEKNKKNSEIETQFNKFVFSKVGYPEKINSIFKQFNPWGDIYFFPLRGLEI